ncbi:efflux RND transporter periplasmic adaptor subunit [Isosphaeraceae bacterium EP7]
MASSPPLSSTRRPKTRPLKLILGLMALAVISLCVALFLPNDKAVRPEVGQTQADLGVPAPPPPPRVGTDGKIPFSEVQQRAVGLTIETVTAGPMNRELSAPGRITPSESRFAYVTPRAAGIVREVLVRIGQDVKAGDVLATIESPEVGTVRLQLFSDLQELDVARTQAERQEKVFKNTADLVDRLEKGQTPDEIHKAFRDRPVGENRELLLSAYANYRLAVATMSRNTELNEKELITGKQFQEVTARYEAAQATYQALMDEMGFATSLANIKAQQALRRAETSVRVTRERLRLMGLDPETDTLTAKVAVESTEANTGDPQTKKELKAPLLSDGTPVSSYPLRAPFDGTVLDRELVVPGVPVTTMSRIFTLADLSSVWVEADVPESGFAALEGSQDAEILMESAAYPGRVFKGRVIYSGDLVNEKTRALKLLGRAENVDRALKPGMYVDVRIVRPSPQPVVQVSSTAIITDGTDSYVYVRSGPESFERRKVDIGTDLGGRVPVLSGLKAGEQVVRSGGFKLKAEAIRLASS